jgi:hypothetical protein
MYLNHSPHAVFRLLITNKSLLQAPSTQWWGEFYHKVVEYQKNLKHSNFLHKLVCHCPSHDTFDAKKTIGLAFGIHCMYCGVRHGHTFIKTLMIRACAKCLHQDLISNGELEFKYGISYSDFIEEYSKKGGIALPKECFRSHPYHIKKDSSIFFQKSKLICLLGIDFDVQEALQLKRKAAAQFLTSRISRLADSIQVNKYFKKHRKVSTRISILEKVHRHSWNSNLRKHIPFRVRDQWTPGGPTYAFFCKGGKWRPGFSALRCSIINNITYTAYSSALHLGLLPDSPQTQQIITMP